MTPDWNNLNMEPGAVAFLRQEYEQATATLETNLGTGDQEGAEAMRRILARIERQTQTGAVGDQPDELPLD
ncbi:MAG TPA: hypothetical protein VJ302_27635 [Blastocatellia bacterium]|nr:hypothetical protein [Blastocatellia bacterium]